MEFGQKDSGETGLTKKPDSCEPGFDFREGLFDHPDVLGHGAFGTLGDFEFYALIVLQFIAETGAGHFVGVHENVAVRAVHVDEPETLAGVEPLHCTC